MLLSKQKEEQKRGGTYATYAWVIKETHHMKKRPTVFHCVVFGLSQFRTELHQCGVPNKTMPTGKKYPSWNNLREMAMSNNIHIEITCGADPEYNMVYTPTEDPDYKECRFVYQWPRRVVIYESNNEQLHKDLIDTFCEIAASNKTVIRDLQLERILVALKDGVENVTVEKLHAMCQRFGMELTIVF